MDVQSTPVPALVVRWLGRIPYADALAMQESRLAARIAGTADDELLLMEHEPAYTLGRGANADDLLDAPTRLQVPIFRVGRGGGATFHGPGQLVAYPIIRLAQRGRDVHRYVGMLEQSLIATCLRWGIAATRRPGAVGVWVHAEKIASIGIGVRRGVTYHGVALNVATDLAYFTRIITCRQADLRLTTMARLLGEAPTMTAVADAFADCFTEITGYRRVQGEVA